MIHRLLWLALAAALATTPAQACPSPSSVLLFHSCWGDARMAIALLPEDLPLAAPPAKGQRLIVTGAYTARENRGEGLQKPVGLFIHRGRVINPNLGRMDGVLLMNPTTGQPEMQHRARLSYGSTEFDLTKLDQRRAFTAEASAHGLSVLQSHLLIVDGHVDVSQQAEAPAFVRRIFFVDADGFGVYQTRSALTLFDAASDIAAALAPQMALNLDMGSYDFCQRTEQGAARSCGSLGVDGIGKLSNLLVLTLD